MLRVLRLGFWVQGPNSRLQVSWGGLVTCAAGRNVDIRLPGKGNSNSHGARPVHQIIAMTNRLRTSRSSINKSLSCRLQGQARTLCRRRASQR